VNLHGPVRVAETAGSGSAKITLSFDAWKGGNVAPTTHTLTVLPPKAAAKEEPVAPNLIASLVHPERKASIGALAFSPDGARLFASGWPSGVVQFWDVASKKEIRRIETRGYRGSLEYAQLTPDWKTLYVPMEKRAVKTFERDGKRQHRYEYSGQIRVWDVASGKEAEPLLPAPGSAPITARLTPDGRFLIYCEQPSYDAGDQRVKEVMMVCDLAAGKKWKLTDGYGYPVFAPDGKSIAIAQTDHEGPKSSVVRILDLGTGKELAKATCPDKERHFSVRAISPDAAVVAVALGGKKAAPFEVRFLDAKTLEDRGKLIGKGDPESYGWGRGIFTPDGKHYVAIDGVGNALLWNVAERRVERTLPVGGDQAGGHLAVSPDGTILAVGWMPKLDAELAEQPEPDPDDLPQPRVSLIDLSGKTPPRILIAPHGYLGNIAFSPDGRLLAFGGAGAVHLFDLNPKQASLDDEAKDTATAFVKAVNAKDLKALLPLCDVPWFDANDDDGDRIIAKRADLNKDWEKKLAKVNTGPKATIRVKEIWTYEKARKTADDEKRRKLLDQVLAKEDRVVHVEVEERGRRFQVTVLVRLRGGKGKVVGIVV
jgi:WD40 repeat protein